MLLLSSGKKWIKYLQSSGQFNWLYIIANWFKKSILFKLNFSNCKINSNLYIDQYFFGMADKQLSLESSLTIIGSSLSSRINCFIKVYKSNKFSVAAKSSVLYSLLYLILCAADNFNTSLLDNKSNFIKRYTSPKFSMQ